LARQNLFGRTNFAKNLEKIGQKTWKNWLENLEKLAGKSDTQLLLPTRFPHCSCTPGHHPIYVQ